MKLLEISANKQHPPIGALLTAEHSVQKQNYRVNWTSQTELKLDETLCFTNNSSISRYLARTYPNTSLYGNDILEATEVDHWLTVCQCELTSDDHLQAAISHLNTHLQKNSYIVGNNISLADCNVWGALYVSTQFQDGLRGDYAAKYPFLIRWYSMLYNTPKFKAVLEGLPVEVRTKLNAGPVPKTAARIPSKQNGAVENNAVGARKEEGKFLELVGAEMGKVIVRFPPEASGYLHIGHAKAALLNQHYQLAYKGKLIMRFDDTNPDKEKEDFEKVILEDVSLLQIKPDIFTYTSDHFEAILRYAEDMLRSGRAYCDDTDAETMKLEREQKKESKNRNNAPSKNLQIWEEMKNGTENGQKYCVRAKLDMTSANGCMRDPTMYRCKAQSHPKTGDKYKVYPTYDFACPIVDSVEGVTHALRTTEYHDRDEQYYWFIDQLKLRKPHIWEYSRLNMTNTVLSKRKLAWFVNDGYVTGWDDPRFPTVRGILRHGMTVEGLKQFIIAQGSSRSVVTMEWDKIWAFNRKVIDPIAPRFTAVEKDAIVVRVTDCKTVESMQAAKHPKNAEIGTKTIWTAPEILIDSEDAMALKEGEDATFINWGNLTITKINKKGGAVESVEAKTNLDNKDYKKTLKITWLANVRGAPATPCSLVYYEHIISKPVLGPDDDFKNFVNTKTKVVFDFLGDPELATLKKGEIIQLQRKGFFICDRPYLPYSVHACRDYPVVLIYVPDGHVKEASASASAQDVKAASHDKKAVNVGRPSGDNVTDASKIHDEITNQGNVVRQVKSAKAPKEEIDREVKKLLALKESFKQATGQEWKPGVVVSPPAPVTLTAVCGNDGQSLNDEITNQGDIIRQLKLSKAPKDEIDKEVKNLLGLKAAFKQATGQEWKPGVAVALPLPAPQSSSDTSAHQLNEAVAKQGDVVRQLKANKAAKDELDREVKRLLLLKEDFKKATGQDWKPGVAVPAPSPVASLASSTPVVSAAGADQINDEITTQGNIVRQLKSDKASKVDIDAAVKRLLTLKESYKKSTGQEWKPGVHVSTANQRAPSEMSPVPTQGDNAVNLKADIDKQGERVRQLKSSGATKVDVDKEVQTLLALKKQYTELTGEELSAGARKPAKTSSKSDSQNEPKKKQTEKSSSKESAESSSSSGKKQTRLGLEAKKGENFSEWYSQVITKSEMIDYYDISGCYILRPWSYNMWEAIKAFFDDKIKESGVQNCYFPMFVSQAALEREKSHIADFSPEVAWVTKSGDSDLSEPIAVRPTSETGMYPAYAKWIQSHRDLPLRLNQWNNVVRWEFKHPQPFLRTREFLWQEGHSAYATKEEAVKEVYEILEYYRRVYEDLCAVPVIPGQKTEKEKFAGGDFTTTVEAYIPTSGRGIQGATSHHLGQNFSKMFEIVFEHPETGDKTYVHQNSWGITTRTIGVVVMVHGDDQGLVLPPKLAHTQVVIIPCGITASLSDTDKADLLDKCRAYEALFRAAGVRCRGDYRDNYSPGWKFNHWELKGLPIRLELGPKDLKQGQFVAVRRDTGQKLTFKENDAVTEIQQLLDLIQFEMFNRAKKERDEHLVTCHTWNEFSVNLNKNCIILAPFCGDGDCEEVIKKDSTKEEAGGETQGPTTGAKSLCIPFEQPELPANAKCIQPACKKTPQKYTLFGRSY